MADIEEKLEAAVATIRRAIDAEEFDKALKFCNKVQSLVPLCQEAGYSLDEDLVRRCRLFALLNLSRWADALQACEAPGGAAAPGSSFERAYCLYRLNRFQEALELLKGEESSEATRLEAQVRYRMGDYAACAKAYETLFDEEEDVGLLVNAVASHVSGGQAGKAIDLLAERQEMLESSYELSFNLACALIDDRKLSEAEEKLVQARKLCAAEILQADEPDEAEEGGMDDHEELAAIHVQRACVLQRRGAADEAAELYNQVLKFRVNQAEVDVTVLAVACNNVVALGVREGKSLFDMFKRISIASKESLEQKLTKKQVLEIGVNKILLLLKAKNLAQARVELDRLRETHPDHPHIVIIQAAIAFAEKNKKNKVCEKGAEETLQSYLAEHPDNEEVHLALAGMYLQQNQLEKAAGALGKLPIASRSQLKALQARAALYRKLKAPDKAMAAMREAIAHLSEQDSKESEEAFAAVLRYAAQLAKQLDDKAFAAEVYQLYLEKIDGDDVEALCGLVQSLSATDVERAEQYAERLRVPSYAHLDPEELEQAPPPKNRNIVTSQDAAAAAAAEAKKKEQADRIKAKRKRQRKIRYPKNFDAQNPGPPPDPERWLPKHERAEYKKKMRKRDKALMRGPQGAVVADDNAYRKQGPSTAQVEVATDSKTGSRRNQGKRNQGARPKK